jgi:hypothetical protein
MQVFQAVITCVEILCLVATCVVAIWGVTSWRRELRGTVAFSTAKDYIEGAFRVRDAIRRFQGLPLSAVEWSERAGGPDELDADRAIFNNLYAYDARCATLMSVVYSWYPAVVAAESVLGKRFRELADELGLLAERLNLANQLHHSLLLSRRPYDDVDMQYGNMLRGVHEEREGDGEVVESDANKWDDGFQDDLDRVFAEIEQRALPYLHAKRLGRPSKRAKRTRG